MPDDPPPCPASEPGRAGEVFWTFLGLGLGAFGGPIAHIALFRTVFCDRRRWLDEAAFADLLALCQVLPGPASSQLGFAIGHRRAGLAGGVAAFVGFTTPSALVMILAALGMAALDGPTATALLAGLKIAAVAVVADAVIQMAQGLCRGRLRAGLALSTLALLLAWPALAGGLGMGMGTASSLAGAQILALVMAGAVGARWLADPHPPPSLSLPAGSAAPCSPPASRPVAPLPPPPLPPSGRSPRPERAVILPLVGLGLLLVGLPLLAPLGTPDTAPGLALALAEALARSGALVFGGGHVVLPLIQAEVVRPGWIDTDTFLAGYGVAQALPGPLFTIGTYVGAAAAEAAGLGPGGVVLLALVATLALFLPGGLLVLAALPVWDHLRRARRTRGALAGMNAAVVGLLAAALWTPVLSSGLRQDSDAALAVLAFLALRILGWPPWLVVCATAAAPLAAALAAV